MKNNLCTVSLVISLFLLTMFCWQHRPYIERKIDFFESNRNIFLEDYDYCEKEGKKVGLKTIQYLNFSEKYYEFNKEKLVNCEKDWVSWAGIIHHGEYYCEVHAKDEKEVFACYKSKLKFR